MRGSFLLLLTFIHKQYIIKELYWPTKGDTLIRYVVVPKDNTPYASPTNGEETTYQVKEQNDQKVLAVQVVVQLHTDWAPGNVIRIEGYVRTIEGTRGVIGYYKLHSTNHQLGILEIQDI
jgi:hypothetical protein